MRVSDEDIFDFISLDTVLQKVHISICREIYQKVVVYYRLRARADVFTAESSRLVTEFTVTKQSGKSLCRSSTKIRKPHKNHLSHATEGSISRKPTAFYITCNRVAHITRGNAALYHVANATYYAACKQARTTVFQSMCENL